MTQFLLDYMVSLKKEPPIPAGTPDPMFHRVRRTPHLSRSRYLLTRSVPAVWPRTGEK